MVLKFSDVDLCTLGPRPLKFAHTHSQQDKIQWQRLEKHICHHVVF